jgi:hypothetical protein
MYVCINREGGCLVPAFIHSPLFPKALAGTKTRSLFHVTDILPTLVSLVGGKMERNKAVDGLDMMPALLASAAAQNAQGVQSAAPQAPQARGGAKVRTEMLYTLNGACHKGFVNPNAAVRVGEMKLLVDCFNITTKAAAKGTAIYLHNLTGDPSETLNLAKDASHADTVTRLMGRLAEYAASTDQYPPTLFPEHAKKPDGPDCPAWNFQCPQCGEGGAHPSTVSGGNGTLTFNPWCDNVTCTPITPTPVPPTPPTPPPPVPPPTPHYTCPSAKTNCWFTGDDLGTTSAADFTACCADCAAHDGCSKWVWDTAKPAKTRCHLHRKHAPEKSGGGAAKHCGDLNVTRAIDTLA